MSDTVRTMLEYIVREANNPSGGDPIAALKEIDRMARLALAAAEALVAELEGEGNAHD